MRIYLVLLPGRGLPPVGCTPCGEIRSEIRRPWQFGGFVPGGVSRGDVCRFDSMFRRLAAKGAKEPQKEGLRGSPWLTSPRADEVAARRRASSMRHPPQCTEMDQFRGRFWPSGGGCGLAGFSQEIQAVTTRRPGECATTAAIQVDGVRRPRLRGAAADIQASIARSERSRRKCAAKSNLGKVSSTCLQQC